MKNFFKGISLSSIAAGALAAVTSFLLSAKIGIAGSVIGVAIGSIVSAVSSQIYQNVLHESGRKLQDVAGTTGDGDDDATETAADTDTTASTDANAQDHTAIIANPVALPAPASHELGHGPRTVASDAARRLSHGDETQLIGNAPVDADATIASGMPPRAGATVLGPRRHAKRHAHVRPACRSQIHGLQVRYLQVRGRSGEAQQAHRHHRRRRQRPGGGRRDRRRHPRHHPRSGNRYCGPRLGAPVEHPDRAQAAGTAGRHDRRQQRHQGFDNEGRHRFDRQGLDRRQQQLDQQWQWIDRFHSGQRF